MEAVVKNYGHYNEIKRATTNLKESKVWGKDEIVKEGNSLFNMMHRLYPDLRHGSTEVSSMSMEEAEYWISRICCFVIYIENTAKNNGFR